MGGATGGKNEDDDDGDEGEGDGDGEDDGDDVGPPPTKVSTRSKRRGDGQLKPTASGILQTDVSRRYRIYLHIPILNSHPFISS
jgi:hypothetical protein